MRNGGLHFSHCCLPPKEVHTKSITYRSGLDSWPLPPNGFFGSEACWRCNHRLLGTNLGLNNLRHFASVQSNPKGLHFVRCASGLHLASGVRYIPKAPSELELKGSGTLRVASHNRRLFGYQISAEGLSTFLLRKRPLFIS